MQTYWHKIIVLFKYSIICVLIFVYTYRKEIISIVKKKYTKHFNNYVQYYNIYIHI